jgi:hypothetical protein
MSDKRKKEIEEVGQVEEITEEKPQESKPQGMSWNEAVMMLLQKSPDPLGKITETIVEILHGSPEEIKAEYSLVKSTTLAFVGLMSAIIVITSVLAVMDKLSGDTVAFIFGTAFGSIITFLYRYLSGKED